MPDQLSIFVSNRCIRVATGVFELKAFCEAFYDSLPPAARNSWRRSRVVGELTRAGFPIGMNHGIAMIGGLAPRGQLRERDGRLELVNHA
jgi:hypothetical protein